MKELYGLVDDHVQQYENGTIPIADGIEFSMYQRVKQTTHYILSRYLDGGANDNKDPITGARRSFRNIGNGIVDLEWRAKNIDRKSIEAHATDGDYIFSLVVQKELQQWMKDNNFGQTIDDFQRKESEYGSVLLKKTETADELIIEPVNWSTMAVDPRDIENGMKVDKHFLSPLELKAKRGIWDEKYENESAIDAVLAAAKRAYRSEKGEKRVEVLDIEGQFEARTIYPDDYTDDDEAGDEIGLYNVIIAVVKNKKFCLYKTKLTESRYKHKARKSVEGRDFGMGVWEEVTEAQIATNEAVIDEREALNLTGKVVVTTNKKGLPSALSLMNGETIELEDGEFFKAEPLRTGVAPGEHQRVVDSWFINTQRDQSAYPGITGEEPKASTPMGSLQLQSAQASSIFNKRRDSDGFFLGEIIVDWVMPFLIKRINKEHKLTASYSKKELEQLDRAIREFHSNNVARESILSGQMFTGDDKLAVEDAVQQQLDRKGNERTLHIPKGYLTLERVKEKVRFDITDEMSDDQRRLNAIATALGQLPPGDTQRSALVQEMMEMSGLSSASFPVNAVAPSPQPVKSGTPTRVNDVLPAGQQAA
jgi:hypothetical protein